MFSSACALLLVSILSAGAAAQGPVPPAPPLPRAEPIPAPNPPAPGPVVKLELPAPQTVPAGSGFIKLKTNIPGADVAWDVFGVFSDPRTVVQQDVSGDTLYLGIPAVGGAIRITATALVAGRLQQAVTFVTIAEPLPAVPPTDPVEPAAMAPAAGAAGLVITLIGVGDSPPLRAAVEKAGHRLYAYADARDPKVTRRPDLVAEIADAGGAPVVVVSDAKGNHRLTRKMGATTDAAVIALVNEAAKGGK